MNLVSKMEPLLIVTVKSGYVLQISAKQAVEDSQLVLCAAVRQCINVSRGVAQRRVGTRPSLW